MTKVAILNMQSTPTDLFLQTFKHDGTEKEAAHGKRASTREAHSNERTSAAQQTGTADNGMLAGLQLQSLPVGVKVLCWEGGMEPGLWGASSNGKQVSRQCALNGQDNTFCNFRQH